VTMCVFDARISSKRHERSWSSTSPKQLRNMHATSDLFSYQWLHTPYRQCHVAISFPRESCLGSTAYLDNAIDRRIVVICLNAVNGRAPIMCLNDRLWLLFIFR
jgi:hypothetical protein